MQRHIFSCEKYLKYAGIFVKKGMHKNLVSSSGSVVISFWKYLKYFRCN